MRVVGIIAEYNPFHSGHAYHLEQAKTMAKADYALVVMSGEYVQRGEPALFPKGIRAKWALQNGADLVIELPVVFSLTSAQGFARGAVSLLEACGLVDALCFGSECGDRMLLSNALEAERTPDYSLALQAALKAGRSYPAARQTALQNTAFYPGPNDILAMEYLRALEALGSSMEPISLLRRGANHDQDGFHGVHASASALRQAMAYGDWDGIVPYLPERELEEIRSLAAEGKARYFPLLSQAILYALRRLSREELAALGEVREGLENPIYQACRAASTTEELLSLVKTRRYPMARLKRVCLCALLGITGEDLRAASEGLYIRVLGARKNALALLRSLAKAAKVPFVTRFADTARLQGMQRRLFALDRLAAETACLASQNPQSTPFDFGDPFLLVD